MPTFLKERQNRNNKVSIEYPARLVIKGKTVMDEFPDWHTVLYQDRYQLLATLSDSPTSVQTNPGQFHSPAGLVSVPAPLPPIIAPIPAQPQPRAQGVYNGGIVSGGQRLEAGVSFNNGTAPPRAPRQYSQVVAPAPSTWNPRINVPPGQPFSVNSGTYLNGASASQRAGQSVSVATTAVIPGTGNIPHYSNSGAGNQGTGRPTLSPTGSALARTGLSPLTIGTG